LLGPNKLIMRWLAHRGGALDYREHCAAHPGEPFPVAVVIGADPATILAAVTPVPDTLSEYQFAGLLARRQDRGGEVHRLRPAGAGIARSCSKVSSHPGETAAEGPFGDHTGYYNEVAEFPVFTVERITLRRDAIYHSTYTGKPPDEPAMLGLALNEVFVPLLQKQFPEIVDFYLPPEGCSYRMAVVSIKKQYPGHAKRVMFGIWSFLRQFMYTKFIIVTDDDVDVRSWPEVIWALTTRVDAARDTLIAENTPIDYLDFASPVASLGSKMGIDATNKWPGETTREWGRPIVMDEAVKQRVDLLWKDLGLVGGDDRTRSDSRATKTAPTQLDGPRAWCHVMYGLHALSAASGILSSATIIGAFVFGWPSIIAVIINYLTRNKVRGTWLDSHWRWQLRSFWFAALWLLAAGVLMLTLIGIPAAIMVIVSTGLWVLYRVIRGWLALLDRRRADCGIRARTLPCPCGEAAPEAAITVAQGLFLGSNIESLLRLLEAPTPATRLRVFRGFASWAPDQLESEIDRGDWHLLPVDADVLFNEAPDGMWLKLWRRATQVMVRAPSPDGGSTLAQR
jgi:uncharacterized membrane protein